MKTRINKILLILVSLLALHCTPSNQEIPAAFHIGQRTYVACAPDIQAKVQSGDIVLRKCSGFISEGIIAVLNEPIPLSHCGIIFKENDQYLVLHTLSNQFAPEEGIQVESLGAFIQDCASGDFYISRFKNTNPFFPSKLRAEALKLWAQKIPFDYEWDLETDDALYCSELIYKLLNKTLGRPAFEPYQIKDAQAIKLNAFLNPSHFERIYHQSAPTPFVADQ